MLGKWRFCWFLFQIGTSLLSNFTKYHLFNCFFFMFRASFLDSDAETVCVHMCVYVCACVYACPASIFLVMLCCWLRSASHDVAHYHLRRKQHLLLLSSHTEAPCDGAQKWHCYWPRIRAFLPILMLMPSQWGEKSSTNMSRWIFHLHKPFHVHKPIILFIT